MRSLSLRIVLVIAIVLGTGGCLGGFPGLHGDQPWVLTAGVTDEQTVDGTLEIRAEVRLDGVYGDETSISDVRLCALDDDGNRLETATVGRISAERPRANVTFTLQEPPTKLVFDYGTVDTDTEYDIEGVEREGERRYSTFYQDGPRCGG